MNAVKRRVKIDAITLTVEVVANVMTRSTNVVRSKVRKNENGGSVLAPSLT